MQLSHETIYRSLFVQTRGVLKKELTAHLHTGRQMRQAKGGPTPERGLGQIAHMVSIRERPAGEPKIEPCRAIGKGTALWREQHAHRDICRAPFPLHDAGQGAEQEYGNGGSPRSPSTSASCPGTAALSDLGPGQGDGLPTSALPSLPMCKSTSVIRAVPGNASTGASENTNGLLRQYFPKGTDLSPFSQS